MAYGSSWAKDWIPAAAVTYDAATATLDPQPTAQDKDHTHTPAATGAAAVGFLTHCTIAGTPGITTIYWGLPMCQILCIFFYLISSLQQTCVINKTVSSFLVSWCQLNKQTLGSCLLELNWTKIKLGKHRSVPSSHFLSEEWSRPHAHKFPENLHFVLW